MRALLSIVLLLSFIATMQGCYYDNEQVLYPAPVNTTCDTAAVTYTGRIAQIVQTNCYGSGSDCHATSNSASGYNLETIGNVQTNIDLIIADVQHVGPHDMPLGLPKLSDCDINAFVAWRNNGMPQ